MPACGKYGSPPGLPPTWPRCPAQHTACLLYTSQEFIAAIAHQHIGLAQVAQDGLCHALQGPVSYTHLDVYKRQSITTAPLTPKHDLREVRGSYMALTDRRNYDGTAVDDYLHTVSYTHL